MRPPAVNCAATGTQAGWAPGPDSPSLAEGVLDVWRADLTRADEHLADLLCEEELARAARLASERDRLLWVRSRGLLRTLLGAYLHADPRALRFTLDTRGKPRLHAPAGAPPNDSHPTSAPTLSFNLSHSGALALYAFCVGAPVGIDVEGDRRSIDEAAIAARVLGAQEAADLRAIVDPSARRREFLRMWTRYEAELKCLGTGIGAGAADVRGRVWLAELEPGAGAAGAVACTREPRELRCWAWC